MKGSIHKGKLDDSWKDFGFRTIYTIKYSNLQKNLIEIGSIKLGEFNMNEGQLSPDLPSEFTNLKSERFFQLGVVTNITKG